MAKDDQFWLNTAYLVFAAVMAFVGYKFIETMGIQFDLAERYDNWFPAVLNIGTVVIAAGSTLWLRSDAGRRTYYLNSIAEIRKVTWPSFEDTKRMTIVVVVVVAVFAFVLSIFDLVWSSLLKMIIA